MARRIVVPEGTLQAGLLELPEELAHYVARVLRIGAGEAVELSDGAGVLASGVVSSVRGVVVVLVSRATRLAKPVREVSLFQAVGKGDKMDAVVRQATELGATRIVPVTASRGVARLDGRVERWRAIAEDAIRVSGRPRRPVIEEVVPLASVFGRARARVALCLAGSARSSVGAAVGDGQGLRDGYEVLIGPEGGLDPEEIAAAAAAGFSQVQLGPYTLRTETAGPAVLAILQYVAGALDPTDQES